MRRLPLWVAALGLVPGLASAQVSDPQRVISQSNIAPPAVGGTFTDPAFGVTIRRLTDRGARGGIGTAEYPQLQAVNADETRILLSTEADYRIVDLATGQETHAGIDLVLPRWHPMDPDVLIGFNQRSGGNIRFQHMELMGGGMAMRRDVVNISNLGFTGLTQGSWEDASSDGRYIPIHNQMGGGDQAAIIDTVMGQVALRVDTGGVDWVGVTPSGQYMAVQHSSRGTGPRNGLVIYSVATGQMLGHATDHGEHGDLGVDAQGNEVFGTVAWTDLCAQGEAPCFSISPLPDTIESNNLQNRRIFDPPVGNYTSCRALRRGGFCVSSDDYGRPGGHPFRGEVWLNRMSDGAVLRLAHHRTSANSYYALVRPTLSPTGRYALFTTDWAGGPDLYVIDLQPFLNTFLTSAPPPMDAGVVDTGPPPPPPDAGFDDSGTPIDSGPPPPPPDGGVLPRDSGVHRDSGTSADDRGNDDFVPTPRGTSGGCTGVAPSDLHLTWLVGLGLLGLARRRRR